jgi:hypothetical protein
MGSSPLEVIKNSLLYRVSAQVSEWAEESLLVRVLDDERVLVGLLSVGLLASIVRILSSGLHVTVRFLSFALLFVVLAAVTWNYTEPLTQE